MAYRILVTGSRKWDCYPVVRDAIAAAAAGRAGVVVVHGAAPGADRQAARAAAELGLAQEPHPADWRLGPHAGPKRNAEMVAAGADVCLAFFWPAVASKGTAFTVRAARRAGIEVRRHYLPVSPPPENPL